ncbi:hypothetical protein H0Z60_10230 [Ectothiorhodospiraceae bacterium WFHF3C12]|nr:hypothetical protein [Ectothiorhodospiraceae bacterium WFHF3C12]
MRVMVVGGTRHWGRHFLLEAAEGLRLRCLGDRVDARALAEGRNPTMTITRAGSFWDPRYGDFQITREMLESMVRNFDADVYGQAIALDVAHRPNDGAAGYFKRLFLDGNKLRGEVGLTDYGRDAIREKGFRYLSAEFVENYVDNETRQEHGPTLLGAGLVVRPAIKRLDPVELSEESRGDGPLFIDSRVSRILSEEIAPMWEKLIKELQEQLGSLKLAEAVVTQLVSAAREAGKNLGDDEAAAKALKEQFLETGKKLAEAVGSEPIQLSIQAPAQEPQNVDEKLRKLLEEQQQKQAEQAKKLEEQRETKLKLFDETVGEIQGITDDEKKQLGEARELVTAEMTDDQVKRFAEHQRKIGEQLAASRQLANMGFGQPQGNVHVSLDEANTAKQLQEQLLKGLRETSSHRSGRLRLSEKVNGFVDEVLGHFDRMNGKRLYEESKRLAGGTTGIGDTDLPAGFQRTVIREALSDLRVLELVQTLTDFQAQSTTEIPYEERDTSAVSNEGVVYEGQGIHRASIAQKMDTAYVLPMKLAFLISNEVMHFSRTSQINWDAWARNVESNARVLRELVVRRICNTLQREADSYMAASVTDEDFSGQLDGSTVSTVKTVEFPIVRPFQQHDLRGNTVGSLRNPITVQLNSSAIEEYDGTGTQTAGTYYRVTSYNLGYIQFVNETGSPVTPAASAGDDVVSYDYATNIKKFDLDAGSDPIEKHLNGLLRAIGERKAVLDGDRFVRPDYLLMSPVLNNQCTNAEMFEADAKRNGTDSNGEGDLDMVKGVPAWSTNAPGVDMGEERILIGQRGGLSYVVAKPFMTGEPFEHVDSNGRATGQKQAYGEEYNAVHMPAPLRSRMTSVLAYSATGR